MLSITRSILFIFLLLAGISISCNVNKKYTAYQCPMNCQIDTVYSKMGQCPVCNMDLIGLEKIDSNKFKIINN